MDLAGATFTRDGCGDEWELRERNRAVACIELLDRLGWPAEDERTEYEVPVTPAVVAWLRDRLEQIDYDIGADRADLEPQEAGDERYAYDGMTPEDSAAVTRAKISGDLVIREAFARLVREADLAEAVA